MTVSEKYQNIVLVNPPWITKDENIWHGIKGAMPPLSLLSIGAVLEQAGFNVHVLDAHVYSMSESQVEAEISRLNPDIVGITMMTSTAIVSHRIAQIVKKNHPNTKVVVGGVHPDAMPLDTLRNQSIDYVVRGDGEYTLLDICRGAPIESVAGVSYRKGNCVSHNPDREILKNLKELPRYAYHLVDMAKYYPAVGAYKKLPAINMLMTRGCPGKCIFCNSAETTLRTRPAEQVVEEIIYLRDTYGVKEIQFYDDTFTVMKQNVLEFCRLMKEKKVGVTFSCFARSDCFSEKMALALKEAGCHQVMFGVESGNQQILKILRKDIDLNKTLNAVSLAKRIKLEVRAAFTFGTPGETVDTIEDTLNYALKMDPDLAIFNITTPYPGTQMYAWAQERDLLTTHDWWDYELGNAIVEMPSITRQQLEISYEKAFKSFYNRPKKYLQRFMKIRSWQLFKDTFDAFMFIIFKTKTSQRGNHRLDWLKYKREDFYDFSFEEDRSKMIVPKVLEELPHFS